MKVKVGTKVKEMEVLEIDYKEKLVLIKGKAKLETGGDLVQKRNYRNGSVQRIF